MHFVGGTQFKRRYEWETGALQSSDTSPGRSVPCFTHVLPHFRRRNGISVMWQDCSDRHSRLK